jgi:TonB family protein
MRWHGLCPNMGKYTNREGGLVPVQGLNRLFAVGLLLMSGCIAISGPLALGQEQIDRKVKSKVAPIYPDLAKRMNITGVVKVQITVAANGSVKEAKVMGGHPVLANAALEAVKKWRFDVGPEGSTGIVEFHFDPTP